MCNMHRISRRLVKFGLILVALGATTGLLCGLFGGVVWALGDSSTPHVVLAGLAYTAYFAYLACLVTLAGGVGASALGLTLKAVVLGTAYFRRS